MALWQSELTQRIVGTFFTVYNELGSSFPEFVYERAMVAALRDDGLQATDVVALPAPDTSCSTAPCCSS